jgi:hypothetical protein
MRASPDEYLRLNLRTHELLRDVPLEDVWTIRLPGGGAGRTIQDLRAVLTVGVQTAPRIVKGLFGLRWRIGSLFGWDQGRPAWSTESYVHRLSEEDRAKSTAAPGTPEGRFNLLYRFEHEQLSELRNATVHAFLSLSIRPAPGGYLAYLAVYVKPVHQFTSLYMRAITPFRRLVVYPAIIRQVQRAWVERYGGESRDESRLTA